MDGGPAVTLEVTSEPRHARVARTALGACAALEGFSVEAMDDVRLVIDEIFNSFVAAGATRITFAVRFAHRTVDVAARCRGGCDDTPEHFAILRVLADVIAPGWSLRAADGGLVVDATFHERPRF